MDVPPIPSQPQLARAFRVWRTLATVIQPAVYGIENVPADGSLLVGNHTIYAFLDLPFMLDEVNQQAGVCVRALGEHAHFALGPWREWLIRRGMVRGTRENVRAMMQDRQTILVFPGGAREVNKRKGEKYQLMWKERLGFAKLAIEHGYPIIPFAAVGGEEMLDILIDENNRLYARIVALIKKLTGWPMQPIVRGIGPTPIPRPERLYFWFGEPVDTTRYAGRHEDDDAARAVRDEVKAAVEQGIAFLQAERDCDPYRWLPARLRRRRAERAARRRADRPR